MLLKNDRCARRDRYWASLAISEVSIGAAQSTDMSGGRRPRRGSQCHRSLTTPAAVVASTGFMFVPR